MARTRPGLVIDATPHGPSGRLAGARVLDRPVLVHHLELAWDLQHGPVTIHVEGSGFAVCRALLDEAGVSETRFLLTSEPPPADALVLRTDRLYDRGRLRRAWRRGGHADRALIWRLDSPQALQAASDELIRRRTYQPIGRYWAWKPAQALAVGLRPTFVRPNALTVAAAVLVFLASGLVGFGEGTLGFPSRLGAALALALALILDTADGHLARLQGTASRLGRWLDSVLDDCGEMALHAAAAWSAFVRDGQPGWLVVGMLYGMGKYLFVVSNQNWEATGPGESGSAETGNRAPANIARTLVHALGHADVRWHAWILLAALGRLDLELVVFTLYYPMRAVLGGVRKARSRNDA